MTTGFQLMIEGIEIVKGNQSTDWLINYDNLVNVFLEENHFFNGETVTLWMMDRIGQPTHSNAWGAMFNAKFTKNPYVVWTGRMVPSQIPQAHARLNREYRSMIYMST